MITCYQHCSNPTWIVDVYLRLSYDYVYPAKIKTLRWADSAYSGVHPNLYNVSVVREGEILSAAPNTP
jgi:hypothetical protein